MKKTLLYLIISALLVILLIRCGSNGKSKTSVLDQENIDGKIKVAKLVGSEVPISTADDDQQNPHIINLPDKKLYFVVWEDFRNRNATGSDIYGQFVNYSGRLCGSAFPVYSSIGNQTVPWLAYRDGGVQAVSSNKDDKIVVVWQDEIGGSGGGYVGIREINVNNLTTSTCDSINSAGTTIISKGAVKYPGYTDGKLYRFENALETIAVGDGATNNFNYTLSYKPTVVAGSVTISDGVQTVVDNGLGAFPTGGTINYNTGVISNFSFSTPPKKFAKITVSYKYKYEVSRTEKFDNTSGLSSFQGYVKKVPIKPGTFKIFYNTTSITKSPDCIDDGKGNLLPEGKINYSTGFFSFDVGILLNTKKDIRVTYSYYSTSYPVSFTSRGSNLLSRKLPKITYDNVKDTFKLTWVETRDKTNYISVLAFGHTPVNLEYGDQNNVVYLTIDGTTLNEKTNFLGIKGSDVFTNSEGSSGRIIASEVLIGSFITENYTIEFFRDVNNPVVAADSTSPETFFAFEGKRLRGRFNIDCRDPNDDRICNFWEISTSSFLNYDFDDIEMSNPFVDFSKLQNHIYGIFEKEIPISNLEMKKIDTSDSNSYKPALSFDPITKKFLVAWEDTRKDANNSAGNTKIYGRLIYSGGGFYNTDFLIGYQDTDNDGVQDENVKNSKQSKPYISYDSVNQRYFVIWQDGRNGNISFENLDVMGQYIDLEGSRRGNNYFIATSPGNQLEPKIAYNHTKNEFLAVWKDARSFLGLGASDIYGQRFSLGNPALFLLTTDNKPFSPPLLDFGSVSLGQYATLSFKVKNVGDTTLKLDYVSPPTFNNFSSTTYTHISLPGQLSAKDDNLTLDLVPGAETTLTVK
ncbi:MAG: hypothetical protein N2999_05850, partial [Proteobacteria bacterium]|nr:hypothetical protein [Pseudomonadota bacterium]